MNKIEFELNGRNHYYEAPSCVQLRAAVRYAFYQETFGVWATLAGIYEGTLVDVGANIGYYTNMLATACPDARIIAIEPVVENIRYIRTNCKGNIKLLKCAAHDKCEDVWLSMPSEKQRPDINKSFSNKNTGLMSVYGQGDTGYTCKAPGFPLDVLLRDEKDISFIKMDIEGHELAALRGAKRTIMSHRPVLAVEVRQENVEMAGVSVRDIRDYILGMGYKFFGIVMGDEMYIPEENHRAWSAGVAFMEGSRA